MAEEVDDESCATEFIGTSLILLLIATFLRLFSSNH